MTKSLLGSLAALVLFVLPVSAKAEDWVTKTSPKSVAETVSALTTAIEGAGAKVFATVDHQANARSAGLELSPTTVVIFGNAKIGTPLMRENRKVALDLPQKMLVWQDGETTRIGYLKPETLADRYDLDENSKPIGMMTGALSKLSDAAIK